MVAVSLGLLLADAGTCLVKRVVRGARWHEAHREHLYQRWVAGGVGHAWVSLWIGLGALVLTTLALLGWQTGDTRWYWLSLGAGSSMMAAEWVVVRRLERMSARG